MPRAPLRGIDWNVGVESRRLRTSFNGKLFQIQDQADVVLGLWLRADAVAVCPLEYLVDTVFDELIPASNAHGEKKAGLALWSRQVETYAIKIHKLDIERCRPNRR